MVKEDPFLPDTDTGVLIYEPSTYKKKYFWVNKIMNLKIVFFMLTTVFMKGETVQSPNENETKS